MSDGTYAGDKSPEQAWAILQDETDAVLVDVRTNAEWAWVGLPDLSGLGKAPHKIAWKLFPSGETNENFIADLNDLPIAKNTPILFLCRSGVRSIATAQAATDAGYTQAFNVLGGFEGDKDDNGHRGAVNGWKVAGLPWTQG